MAQNQNQSGLTLIEILISSAILILIIGAVVVFQQDLFAINNFLQQALSIQRDAEVVIRDIVSELRSASQSNTGGYPIEIAGDNSLAFYANIDKDSLKERVHYFIDGSFLKKSVIKPAGNPPTYSTTTAQEFVMVVLRDLISTSAPLFSYYDKNYDGTSLPLAQPVNISDIRLVGVSITIDADPDKLPPPINVSSQVTIRNLKDNL